MIYVILYGSGEYDIFMYGWRIWYVMYIYMCLCVYVCVWVSVCVCGGVFAQRFSLYEMESATPVQIRTKIVFYCVQRPLEKAWINHFSFQSWIKSECNRTMESWTDLLWWHVVKTAPTVSLKRGKTPSYECPRYDTKHLMVRFQKGWSFGECGVPLRCHHSQVHSGPAR